MSASRIQPPEAQEELDDEEIDVDEECDIGREETEAGNYESAAEHFLRAYDADPESLDAVWGMAELCHYQDAMEEAREWYERYLELVPGDPEASHMVASLGGAPAPARAGDAYVRSLFDGFAEDFDRILVDDLKYRAPEHLYREVRRTLPKGARGLNVLDAGCGTGLAGVLFRPLARYLKGVDLSREMLKLARARGVYNSLRTGEITRTFEAAHGHYDLIVAADVFVYVGDLDPVLKGAAKALTQGGHLAFSIECADADGYALSPSGRYVHDIAYVRRMAEQAGLAEVSGRMATLRKEMGKAVSGYVAVYAKP